MRERRRKRGVRSGGMREQVRGLRAAIGAQFKADFGFRSLTGQNPVAAEFGLRDGVMIIATPTDCCGPCDKVTELLQSSPYEGDPVSLSQLTIP